ncbi:hypothetical protein ACUN7V_01680 [Quadrisphaera oryzae]|uniref:hypothetical protein n=1 Tax=Quadrisphaera TaxID=317661 RepID=UPI0016468A13|nr:hypothetical protein [Quadrisphaera sp. RL12-1S]MBC3762739.1 hypothetical protein [Quadrisphaera sp. RL12-1S]
MAADHGRPDGRDPLDQLRADRERHLAEERADSLPPPDWRHDTLDLDLDELRRQSAPAGPPPVVDGSVLSSRTHGGAWRAVRRGAGRARRARVPAGLVVGLVLLAGAGGASAVLGAGASGPQSSPLQTSTTQTYPGTTGTTGTTAGNGQPQGSVRVETGGAGAGSPDGSEAVPGPGADGGQQPAGPPAPGQDAAGGPAGPGFGPGSGPGGAAGGGPGGGPAGGPAAPGRP